jgi:hypothetical protein
VNQHPVGGLSLSGITCLGISVVKVRIILRIKLALWSPPNKADAVDSFEIADGQLQIGRAQ